MVAFSQTITALLATLTVCTEARPSTGYPRAALPPAFFLAGDSTTAKQTSGGGGWGDGFLNTTLKNGATGINFGHNGATTVSFRSGGDWAKVLAAVASHKANYQPYVTIQFGHNDQKAQANISMDQFTKNIEQLVADVKNAGAIPLVLTSLSRRSFSGDPPTVTLSLADVTAAAKVAASNSQATLLDLNKASTDYLNAIGPDNAHTYNLVASDNTHLNNQGSIVFGGMVADLMLDGVPALTGYLQVAPALAAALKSGTYYWP